MCVCVLSRVRLFVTPWTTARQAPLSMGFSRSSALKAAGYTRGVYMLKQVQGGKSFLVNTTK